MNGPVVLSTVIFVVFDVLFSLREHFLFYNKFLIPVKLYLITNGKKFRFKLLFDSLLGLAT